MNSTKSKYAEKIAALTTNNLFRLNGDRILVELLEESERTTKSGLYTTVPKTTADGSDRARIAVVLAVGPGYELESEDKTEFVDVPYKPGDYILINQFGAKLFS